MAFWGKGHAGYLLPEFSDDLAIFTDADRAHHLHISYSISAYFILYCSALISGACKKHPITTLHSTGSEITTLHKSATKMIHLWSFLTFIGFPLTSPSPTYEDNERIVKLNYTHHFNDNAHHYTI